MGGLLTPFELHCVFAVFYFILGFWLSPKIRYWWKGTPQPLQDALAAIEASALNTMHSEMKRVIDDVKQAVAKNSPPTPPVTPTGQK